MGKLKKAGLSKHREATLVMVVIFGYNIAINLTKR
jgi:hypothetical protein